MNDCNAVSLAELLSPILFLWLTPSFCVSAIDQATKYRNFLFHEGYCVSTIDKWYATWFCVLLRGNKPSLRCPTFSFEESKTFQAKKKLQYGSAKCDINQFKVYSLNQKAGIDHQQVVGSFFPLNQITDILLYSFRWSISESCDVTGAKYSKVQ